MNSSSIPTESPMRSTSIPIAQISPSTERLVESSIHANVTLVWPYSSSTKSLSLLLAEPDFRLRRLNGQVKVVFHGIIAENVAKSQVGIGDEVFLSLAGSRLVNNESTTQTPGRYIGWDVHFDDQVLLEIIRSSDHLSTVKVDRPASPLPTAEDDTALPVTPKSSHIQFEGYGSTTGLGSWGSPAFLQRSRSSLGGGGITGSAFEPYAEEDGFVPGKGRKKPRFSMRGSDWRVIDEPESPGEKADVMDWAWIFDEAESAEPEVDGEGQIENNEVPLEAFDTASPTLDESGAKEREPQQTSPPSKEQLSGLAKSSLGIERAAKPDTKAFEPDELQVPAIFKHPNIIREASSNASLPTDTPRLLPIPSPGLPIPSPLVSNSNSPHGYFPSAPTSIPTPKIPVEQNLTAEASKSVKSTGLSDISEKQPEISQSGEVPAVNREETDRALSVSETDAGNNTLSINSEAPTATIQPRGTETSTANAQSEGDGNLTADDGEENEVPVTISKEVAAEDAQSEADVRMFEDGHPSNEVAEVKETEDHDIKSEDSASQTGEEHIGEKENLQQRVELSEEEGEEDEHKHDAHDDESEPDDEQESEDDGDGDGDEGEYESEYDAEEELDKEEDDRDERVVIQDSLLNKPHRTSQTEVIEDESEGDAEDIPEDQRATDDGPVEAIDNHSPAERNDGSDEEEQGYYIEDEGDMDETMYDEDEEEPGDEYNSDAEQGYRDDQGDYVESEYESEDNYEGHGYQQPQKTVHPEVIVLDSDSEDEAPAEPKEEARDLRDIEEVSDEDRSGSDSQAEWSAVEDQEMDDEDMDDERVDDEQVDDEQVDDEQVDDEQVDDEQVDDEQAETQTDDEQIDDHQGSLEATRGTLENQRTRHEPAGSEYSHDEDDDERVDLAVASSENDAVSNHDEQELRLDDNKGQELEFSAHDADQTTHEHGFAAKQDHETSEPPPQNEDMAINPNLHILERVISQPDPKKEHGTANHEPQIKEESSPNDPQPGQSVGSKLWLDGAASPRWQESTTAVSKIRDTAYPDHQLVTPDASQDLVNSRQIDTAISTKDALITPRPTQETFTAQDSHLQDQLQHSATNVPAAPTEDGMSSIGETDSLVLVSLEDRMELEGQPVVDQVEAQAYPEGSLQAVARDKTPETPGRATQHSPGPDRRYPGLRSKLSYFAPLATMVDHFNALVDTISVVCETSSITQSASGKKDYILTLQLTDPSMAGTMLSVQIFRSHKAAFPSLADGDAILLRDFKVKSYDHSILLVSVETSSWAVFNGSDDHAQITGPPVEYGNEEISYAADLRQWYLENGTAMVADNQLQASIERASRDITPASSAGQSESGSIESWRDIRAESSLSARGSRRRKSHRRITIHELRDGRKYAEVGSPSDKESIHELRDGTAYAHL